jgi:hypothetical protein
MAHVEAGSTGIKADVASDRLLHGSANPLIVGHLLD